MKRPTPRWKLGDSVQMNQPIQGIVQNQWIDEDGHEYIEVDWILPETILEADTITEWRPF